MHVLMRGGAFACVHVSGSIYVSVRTAVSAHV